MSSGLTRLLEQTGICRPKWVSPRRGASKGSPTRMLLQFGATTVGAACLLVLVVWLTNSRDTQPVHEAPQSAKKSARPSYLMLDWPREDRLPTKLFIDGQKADVPATQEASGQVKVLLDPGMHSASIIRPGFEPFEQSVSILADNVIVKPKWQKSAEVGPPQPPTAPPPVPPPSQPPESTTPPSQPPVTPPMTETETAEKERNAAEARYATAIEPAEKLIAAWDFQGAAAELAKVRVDGSEHTARLAACRTAVEGLTVLKGRIIEKINTASPPLRKNAVMLHGLGGDLTHADDKAIQAKLVNGTTESHLWQDLNSKASRKLLQLAVDRSKADDWVAAGTMASCSNDVELAERCFFQARSLGATVDVHAASLAIKIVSHARQSIADKEFGRAEAILASLCEKYSDTSWFEANRKEIEALMNTARAGRMDTEAKKLYAHAARLFEQRELFELKPLIAKLKGEYNDTPICLDAKQTPLLAKMERAVSNLGRFVTVRQDGRGDFKTIQAAINASPPYSMIEIQDNGPYYESIQIGSDMPCLVLRGEKSCWPIIAGRGFGGGADHMQLQRLAIVLVANAAEGDYGFSGTINIGGNSRLRTIILGTQLNIRDLQITFDHLEIGVNCNFQNCFVGLPGAGTHTIQAPLAIKDSFFCASNASIFGTAKSRLENVLTLPLRSNVTEFQQCTIAGILELHNPASVVRNSIFQSVISGMPGNSIDFCHCISGKYVDQAKPGTNCSTGDPMFADPKNVNFQLLPNSPCRKKASDGGDLGVRYTPEMLEIMRVAFELRRRGLIKF